MRSIIRLGILAGLGVALAVPAFAEDLPKITLAWVKGTGSAAAVLAAEKGWFKEEGVDVTMRAFDSGNLTMTAVASGDAEVGMTGLTASSYNLAGKGGLVVIGSQSLEKPGYPQVAFVVTNKAWDAGVRTIPDFVGKRIGMTVVGSSGHYSMLLAAQKYKLDPKSITLVPLQNLANLASAFQGDQVDGAIPPVITWRQLQQGSGGHLIAWVGDITPYQIGGVVTSPGMLKDHPDILKKFMAGYIRGTKAYDAAFNNRDKDGKVVPGPGYDEYLGILAKVTGLPADRIKDSLSYIDPGARMDVADIRNQVKTWQDAGLVDASVDPEKVYDLSILGPGGDLSASN